MPIYTYICDILSDELWRAWDIRTSLRLEAHVIPTRFSKALENTILAISRSMFLGMCRGDNAAVRGGSP